MKTESAKKFGKKLILIYRVLVWKNRIKIAVFWPQCVILCFRGILASWKPLQSFFRPQEPSIRHLKCQNQPTNTWDMNFFVISSVFRSIVLLYQGLDKKLFLYLVWCFTIVINFKSLSLLYNNKNLLQSLYTLFFFIGKLWAINNITFTILYPCTYLSCEQRFITPLSSN